MGSLSPESPKVLACLPRLRNFHISANAMNKERDFLVHNHKRGPNQTAYIPDAFNEDIATRQRLKYYLV